MLKLLGALAIVLVAGASAFVLLQARRLKARHRALLAQDVPPLDEEGERLVDAPASLLHGTRFADGAALGLPAWTDPCVGDLWCTREALFLRREQAGPAGGRVLAWPVAWIEEAALVRAFAPLAGKDLPMLRLVWRRGGERLASDFSLKGGMASLEKLRRQLHLLAAPGATLVRLGTLVERGPEALAAAGRGTGDAG